MCELEVESAGRSVVPVADVPIDDLDDPSPDVMPGSSR